jgi:hypothetical protein
VRQVRSDLYTDTVRVGMYTDTCGDHFVFCDARGTVATPAVADNYHETECCKKMADTAASTT